MNKLIGFAVAFAFLCSDLSMANVGDGGSWVTCKDGMKMHSGGGCENHGGVLIAKSTSTPIDTTKRPTPNNSATAKKTKTQKTATPAAKGKKTVSKRTNAPTAKCMDGAMYFSTERHGACASHGGVRHWL